VESDSFNGLVLRRHDVSVVGAEGDQDVKKETGVWCFDTHNSFFPFTGTELERLADGDMSEAEAA